MKTRFQNLVTNQHNNQNRNIGMKTVTDRQTDGRKKFKQYFLSVGIIFKTIKLHKTKQFFEFTSNNNTAHTVL